MSVQKGDKPASIKASPDPYLVNEHQAQRETNNPYGFNIDLGEKMPQIQYTTKKSGQIGSTPASSGKPLRSPIAEPTASNPDQNQHEQFVKPDAIEHSPGAFNR